MSGLIKKISLRDQVYAYIKDGILSQEFKRGENINLDNLSRKLGVSNTPIRESINMLVQEGLIEYKQNNGFFVISPDRETVNEILQVVFFLVVAALRFCHRSGKMDAVLPKMEERLENHRELLENGDTLGYIETTYMFERSIVEGVGNKVLVSEYDGKQTILGFIATYYSDNNLEELKKVFAQHEEIFNLLKKDELEKAILKMREHYYKKHVN